MTIVESFVLLALGVCAKERPAVLSRRQKLRA